MSVHSSPAGSTSGSPEKAGVLSSLLASGRAALEPSAVANSLGAAVGRASLVLKRRGRGGAAPEPPPPPVNVTVHRLFGTEMQVGVTAQTSLEELQQECERASGVPAALLRLCVQEEPAQAGLSGMLRATASTLSSRQRLTRSLSNASTFLLVPEGLGRELRGQGLVAWARENILQPLTERLPPPGTETVLVATLDGTKRPVSVPSSSSIAQLQGEVQRAAGIPPDRQRLLVLEQRPLGRPQRLLRGLLRLLVAAALWLLCWLAAAGRWALRLPPPPAGVQLVLRTESGMSVELAVPPDTTLQQLQTIIYERHGEQLSLQHLWVGAQREGSSSPKWSGAQHGFATGREP